MTLRRRLTLWYGGVLALCLLICIGLAYEELVIEAAERREGAIDPWGDFLEMIWDLAAYCLPPLLIGLAVGWWMTKRALRPLENVINAAERITEETLSERLPVGTQDVEVAQLVEVFNSMLARLDEAFGRVREFTLHASHEIKTPLAILRCGQQQPGP